MKTLRKIFLTIIILFILINFSCQKTDDQSKAEVETMDLQLQNEIADQMIDLYEELLLQNTPEQSRELLVENLIGFEEIRNSGISRDGTTVCWEYKDGLEYCYLTVTTLSNTTSKLSNNVKNQSLSRINDIILPENKNALVLSPHHFEYLGFDESEKIAMMLDEISYNVFYRRNGYADENNISLDYYEQFDDYSVIAIVTHGGIARDGDLFINSGVPITEEIKTYLKDDINESRVTVSLSKDWIDSRKHKVIGLKSSWFDNKYESKLHQSLVYMGACLTYNNKNLANALIGNVGNESAYFGWTHNTLAWDSRAAGINLFDYLVKGKTVEEAYNQMIEDGTTVSRDAIFMKSSNSYKDLALVEYESFIDPRDGKKYKIVKIGEQTWFAENLNFKSEDSWWWKNDESFGKIYGRLYTWNKALEVCPNGWHLPSDEEWKTLEKELGMSNKSADSTGHRGTNQGNKLKSINGWDFNQGINSSGFNALPGGIYWTNDSWFATGVYCYWWTSTENDEELGRTWVRGLWASTSSVYRITTPNSEISAGKAAMCIRCLKD